ncbi:class I SAM-dependent methyltransferase [uncultured Roseobacter sp.]|uniref:class I SAM-dependent methyltransferase n=1 Tax=uncultured Roseobacter sp. TaxID=114847 RepID=UPI00345D1A60
MPAKRVVGCVTNLPFDVDTFDLVTCAWGLEVVNDPTNALRELVRVTRPRGHICTVFCADRPSRSLVGRTLRAQVSLSGRGRFLDDAMLKSRALDAGVQRFQSLNCSGPAAAMIIRV